MYDPTSKKIRMAFVGIRVGYHLVMAVRDGEMVFLTFLTVLTPTTTL